MKKILRLTESDLIRLVKRVLNEQVNPNVEQTGQTQNKDEVITKMGLKPINDAFIKYGFTRNDNPPRTRSLYQLVATYEKKPSFSGNISQDRSAGVKVLVQTNVKDAALRKCNAKTHDLDPNYIILDKNNADCVLGTLTSQITK